MCRPGPHRGIVFAAGAERALLTTRYEHDVIDASTAPWAVLILSIALGILFLAHGLLKLLVYKPAGAYTAFQSLGLPGGSGLCHDGLGAYRRDRAGAGHPAPVRRTRFDSPDFGHNRHGARQERLDVC